MGNEDTFLTRNDDDKSGKSEETGRTNVTTESSEASKDGSSKGEENPKCKARDAYSAKILKDEGIAILAPPQPHEAGSTEIGRYKPTQKSAKDAPLELASPYHEEGDRPVSLNPQLGTSLELASPYQDERSNETTGLSSKAGARLELASPYHDELNHDTGKTNSKTGARLELASPYHDEVNHGTKSLNSKAGSTLELASPYHDEVNPDTIWPNTKAGAALKLAPSYHDERDSSERESFAEMPVGAVRVRGIDWDGNDENESFQQGEIVNDSHNEDNEYLVEAHTVQEPVLVRAKADPWWRRHRWWIVLLILIILISIIAAIVFATVDMNPEDPTSAAPTTFKDGIETDIKNLVVKNIPAASLPEEAIEWVVNERLIQGDSLYSDERALRQYSLLALYLSTSNRTIKFLQENGWLESFDECSWYGVTCDEANIIVSLDVNGSNLSGTIPPDVALLSTGLSSLNLKNNSLTGRLPLEFFELSKLSVLDLASNHLTGGIPNTIRRSTDLLEIDLSINYFSSTVPTEIGLLTSLKKLIFGNNEMIGPIPSEIGYLTSLEELHFQNNQYSSPLPTQMGNLVSLRKVNMENNLLLGPLPSEIGMMKSLSVLHMPHNSVAGKIPRAWWVVGSLRNLEYLDLSDNLLTGEGIDYDFYGFGSSWNKLKYLFLRGNFYRGSIIPGRVSLDLPQLEILDLSNNFFTGTVPDTLFDMTNLKSLILTDNGMKFEERDVLSRLLSKLTSLESLELSKCNIHGSIPTEIGTMKQIQVLGLRQNSLTGFIPTEIGALDQANVIAFGSNNLRGSIPTQIEKLSGLMMLDFSRNTLLSGVLPSELGGLKSLKHLILGFNNIRGSIPTEIGNLIHVTDIDLWVNKLTGTIPSEIQKLEKLKNLRLDSNSLTGTIPTIMGTFGQLVELALSSNALNGQIPTEIGLLSRLASLRLSSNALTGRIPTELGMLNELEELDLRDAELGGQIPTEIASLKKLQKLSLHKNDLSGSIPITVCKKLPNDSIEVDCDTVICHCCGCTQYMMPTSSIVPSVSPSTSSPPSTGYPSVSPTIFPTLSPSSSHIPSNAPVPPTLFPSFSPSSSYRPSNAPSQLIFKNVTFNITLDKYPSETGWMIMDTSNNSVHEVLPGTYSIEFETVYDSVMLRLDFDYTFVLLDSYNDGLTGRVQIYSVDDSQGTPKSVDHLFSGESFSAFRIPFQVTEDGIIDKRAVITIKIRLDDYPYETGWKITDSDGNVLREMSSFTYLTGSETVYESVSLILGMHYTFHLTDVLSDGIASGQVGLYFGDSADNETGIEYALLEQFSEYEILFYLAEDGVINETNQTSSPSSFPVSVLEPPTTRRECPTVLEGGCSICGEGRCFQNPDEYITFPGYEEGVSCAELELAASSGLLASLSSSVPGETTTCGSGALEVLITSACECPEPDILSPPPASILPTGCLEEIVEGGCSLCGEGKCVQNPDVIVTIPFTEESFTCGDLEGAAASGAFITLGEFACTTVSLFAFACECSEPVLQPSPPSPALPPSPGTAVTQPTMMSTPGCPAIVEGGCSLCGEGKCAKNVNVFHDDSLDNISCGVLELGLAHGVLTCSSTYSEQVFTACGCSEPELSSPPPACPPILEGGCSICGVGKCFQNPATLIAAFDGLTCGMLELSAAQGTFVSNSCSILSMLASVCQCS